jgi:hypothetical protein
MQFAWLPAIQTAINGVSGGPHEALLSFVNNAGLLLGPQLAVTSTSFS